MRELEGHYWWFVARRSLAQQLIQRHGGPKPGRILDVGCGTGALMESLQANGWVVGVDFSPEALRFSGGRGLGRLTLGDAQRLPFASGSFDVVVSLDTIEHVPDDGAALAEVLRVLKPGGVFVMNVPAFQWLWGPHDVALMHFRRYTVPEARKKLEAAGFRCERMNYSVFFLFPVVVLRRFMEKFHRGPAVVRLPAVSSGLGQILVRLMEWEGALASRMRLPWGSSVVAVARKEGGDCRRPVPSSDILRP